LIIKGKTAVELKHLLYKRADKIGTITLNRPDQRNAINQDMLHELRDLFHEIEWENEVSVVIVKGAGRGFTSGYDFKEYAEQDQMDVDRDAMRHNEVLDIFRRIRECKMATIAQIHGFCLNGGTDFAHQLDLTVVSDDCLIGYPNMRFWGAGMSNLWLYNMGPQWTKYMMMTGDTVDGRQAEKIGFAIKSVPEEQLEGVVMHVARRLANVAKGMLSAHKMIVNQGMELMGSTSLHQYSISNDCITRQSDISKRRYDRTSALGVPGLIKMLNAGFEAQTAPFEPLED
jgi:enoyl-CoA hydratase